jgi:hypothetical protein
MEVSFSGLQNRSKPFRASIPRLEVRNFKYSKLSPEKLTTIDLVASYRF